MKYTIISFKLLLVVVSFMLVTHRELSATLKAHKQKATSSCSYNKRLDALVTALKSNNIVVIDSMVKNLGLHDGSTDKYDNNLLHYAAAFSNIEIFQSLFYRYFDPASLSFSNSFGFTPLMVAAEYNNEQVQSFLINKKAPKNNACCSKMKFDIEDNPYRAHPMPHENIQHGFQKTRFFSSYMPFVYIGGGVLIGLLIGYLKRSASKK